MTILDSMSDFVEEDFLYKAGSGKAKSPRARQIMADLIALEPAVREPLKVQFSKKRREFGTDLNLHDKENDLSMNIAPLPDSQFSLYAKKKTNEINLSAARTTDNKSIQVNWAKKVHVGLETANLEDLHPKQDFAAIEAESKRNTNTKTLPERLQYFLKKMQPLMEKSLAMNETIDVFKDDFDLVHDDDINATSAATELSIIREVKSFEYPDCKKKMISCIRFQPTHPGQKHNYLATSFVEDLSFDERVEISCRSYKNQILLWDYKDMHLFTPIRSLTSTLEIVTFEFKPGDPNIIVGGAINGQVLIWDLNYRPEDNLGFGEKPSQSAVESAGPISISPAVYSILPELYSIPPAVLTEAYSKKIVNSHRNAIQSIRFLPRNVEFDKKHNLVLKESFEGRLVANPSKWRDQPDSDVQQ